MEFPPNVFDCNDEILRLDEEFKVKPGYGEFSNGLFDSIRELIQGYWRRNLEDRRNRVNNRKGEGYHKGTIGGHDLKIIALPNNTSKITKLM